MENDDPLSAVQKQQCQQEARAIIADETRWQIDGKRAFVTLPNGTAAHDETAKQVRAEIQRRVTGRTPDMRPVGDNFIISTDTKILEATRQAIGRASTV